jgi:hypothetical protein
MEQIAEIFRKHWFQAVGLLTASAPPAIVLYFQNALAPYVAAQDPVVLLNGAALLLWLVLLLTILLALKRPWLRWDVPTGTWISRIDGLRYCANCRAKKIITPLKNEVTGWRCMHCQIFYRDPERGDIESPKKKRQEDDARRQRF